MITCNSPLVVVFGICHTQAVPSYQVYDWNTLQALVFNMTSNINFGITTLKMSGVEMFSRGPIKFMWSEIVPMGPVYIKDLV